MEIFKEEGFWILISFTIFAFFILRPAVIFIKNWSELEVIKISNRYSVLEESILEKNKSLSSLQNDLESLHSHNKNSLKENEKRLSVKLSQEIERFRKETEYYTDYREKRISIDLENKKIEYKKNLISKSFSNFKNCLITNPVPGSIEQMIKHMK